MHGHHRDLHLLTHPFPTRRSSDLHNYLVGKPAGNPVGPAVTMLKTTGGTPYYLNFHASLEDVDETGKRRLGNTSIIGQSGAGKTVLLGHLIDRKSTRLNSSH